MNFRIQDCNRRGSVIKKKKVYMFERRLHVTRQRSAGQEGEVTGVHDEAGVQVQALLVKVEFLV